MEVAIVLKDIKKKMHHGTCRNQQKQQALPPAHSNNGCHTSANLTCDVECRSSINFNYFTHNDDALLSSLSSHADIPDCYILRGGERDIHQYRVLR